MWAGLQGLMDEVPVDDVLRFERRCWSTCGTTATRCATSARPRTSTTTPRPGCAEQIAEFKKGFQTSEGKLLAGREEHVALEEEDVNQEQIVKQKRG